MTDYSKLILPPAHKILKTDEISYNSKENRKEGSYIRQNKQEINTDWIIIGIDTLKEWDFKLISLRKLIAGSGDRIKDYEIVSQSTFKRIMAEKDLEATPLDNIPDFLTCYYKRISGNKVIFKKVQENRDGTKTINIQRTPEILKNIN